MTMLQAHSDPQFTEHPRSVLTESNGESHNVHITLVYFYIAEFTQVTDLLATRPENVLISSIDQERK